ncbi:hypothetical protein LP420_17505 [Massilia sp. B-10]|nr:hypothetical protein LP420_17505 [Massilia sp. B-10]
MRIGRYLNQFITTRDLNVENVVNTESVGVGVRVICNGAYGFAATSDMSPDSVAAAVPGRRHRQGECQAAGRAGAPGARQGRGRSGLGHADQEGLAQCANQGKGRPPDRRQQG